VLTAIGDEKAMSTLVMILMNSKKEKMTEKQRMTLVILTRATLKNPLRRRMEIAQLIAQFPCNLLRPLLWYVWNNHTLCDLTAYGE
jgi:hypothetical protein